ncbi:MAG: ADP-ribosylglycohydrolase family protein, partial [candidate division KSB1 bacterium]|nr:ADP-ribosylglycohydrolase family protein [candidate division KSB1 bacterium]
MVKQAYQVAVQAGTAGPLLHTAFQTALSATEHTARGARGGAGEHVRRALGAAVAAGHDTDTVAAIAGALLGARWGAAALPGEWTGMLHGWPGLDADGLA